MISSLSQADIAHFAEANQRKALTLVPELPNHATKSFVGGYPRLPAGMDWPMDDRHELMFLAQIDLGGLPWRPDGWPERGTLYFFHNPKLEGADHSKIAISSTNDGSKYPSRFVYFASHGQKLVTAKPSHSYTSRTFFQYCGDGYYRNGDPHGPRVKRDCLPHAAIRFAPHVQYYSEAWFNDKASDLDILEALDKYGEASSHLHRVLEEKATKDRSQSIAELSASWFRKENDEEVERRIYGGARHIDTDGLLQTLQENYRFKYIRKQSRRDARYASWPETGGMVMHHAMLVASSPNVGGRKDEPLSPLVRRCVDKATEWAEWGHKRARQALSQAERDRYLNWARTAFRETLHVYSATLPPQKGRVLASADYQAPNVAESLLLLSDAREFGLRILSPEQVSAMPKHSHTDYLGGVLRGQLFGWGSELQTEVRDNAEHLCLASIYGNRDISFEADFKIWLPQPLQPDAWQPVMVVNAIN